MREQMEAALHLSHPYGRPVIGWPEEVRHIGRVEAQDFYLRHYAPNNAILVVAGDVTPEEVRLSMRKRRMARFRRATRGACRFCAAAAARRNAADHCAADVKVAAVPAALSRGELYGSQTRRSRSAGNAGAIGRRRSHLRRSIASSSSSGSSRPMPARPMTAIRATPASSPSMPCRDRACAWTCWNRRSMRYSRAMRSPLPRTVDMERAKTQLVAEARLPARQPIFDLASAYGQALAIGLDRRRCG